MAGQSKASQPEEGSGARLAFLAGGVIGAFTVFGYAQEAVTQTKFDGKRFSYPSFLVALQALGSAALAGGILVGKGQDMTADVPAREYVLCSLGCFGAHEFSMSALSYISFPMQVVCKSCKAIPVMIGERLLVGKTHSRAKQLEVLVMSAGVVAFTLLGQGGGAGSSIPTRRLLVGLGLVAAALGCDGFYGPYQSKICRMNSKITADHLQFNVNLWEALFASALCAADGELVQGLRFVRKHPAIVPKLGAFSLAMGIGQLFICSLQKEFGALTTTTTTTLRKLITVLFSCFWYGHALKPSQWAAVLAVFLSKPIAHAIADGKEKAH